MLLITIWFLWAGCHSAASETSFIAAPGNRSETVGVSLTLEWSYVLNDVSSDVAYAAIGFRRNLSSEIEIIYTLTVGGHLFNFTEKFPAFFSRSVQVDSSSQVNGKNGTVRVKLHAVSLNNSGYYSCGLNAIFNVIERNELQLIVSEPPSKPVINCTSWPTTFSGRNIVVKEGSSLSCSCDVIAGTPSPTIYWKTPTRKINSPVYVSDKISRSENGNYTCVAENSVGKENETVHVDVQYFGLTCMVNVNTSGVYFTTTAAANPSIQLCEPYACNDEKRLNILPERNITVYQYAENSIDSEYCNRTIFFERRSKCKSSPKEFRYTFVSTDTHGENVTRLFVKTTDGIPVNDSALLMRLKDKLFTGDEEYNPEKDNDRKTTQLFEKLCSGVSVLDMSVTSVLIQTFLLAAIFIMNDGH